jgi:hypothetical protein
MNQPDRLPVSAVGKSIPGAAPGSGVPETTVVTGVAPQALQTR